MGCCRGSGSEGAMAAASESARAVAAGLTMDSDASGRLMEAHALLWEGQWARWHLLLQ